MPVGGGVYQYGKSSSFPSLTYQNENYWVDVVFQPTAPLDSTPPTVVSFSPAASGQNIGVNSSATVKFSEAIDPTSITEATLKLIDSGNNFVPALLSYNAATLTTTLAPTSPLAFSMNYTIVVTGGPFGVKDAVGNPIAQTIGSSFTTVAAPAPDLIPPTITSVNPVNGSTNISTGSSFTVAFSEGLNAATVDANSVLLLKNATNRVNASQSYNATNRTVTITPLAPLENATNYTIYIHGGASGVTDLSSNAIASDYVSSFTTVAAPISSSLWPATATPGTVDSNDSKSIEVGMKFTSDSNGYITGLRFYKSTKNTGTHIANLWTSTGQLLATATFTSETASGWQQVNFATPVAVAAGTTYIASYFAPKGHYSDDVNYFATPLNSGPLHVTTGGSVYQYNKTSTAPTLTYQNTNYWVDVVLSSTPATDTTPPTVSTTSPANGATNISTGSAVTVTFSEAMDATTISNSTVKLLDGNSMIAASVVYNASNKSVTITPVNALANSKTYTISVLGGIPGVKDAASNPLAQTFSSTFTTAAASQVDTTPPSVLSVSPANGATNILTSAGITVAFSEALNAATVSTTTVKLLSGSTSVAATIIYNATNKTATITPTAALANSTTYSVSILGGASGIKDVAGNALTQTFSSTFTTAAAAPTPTTIWPTSAKPGTTDAKDASAVELGLTFTADVNGYITGVRFYKSSGNTGMHIANLWTSTGQLLATATFTSESKSGWQQVNFATPVAITAGTTYVASYYAPKGHYSVDRDYFASPLTSGHLKVVAGGGVYQYGSSSAFPTQSYQNSNYWVDVQFAPSS